MGGGHPSGAEDGPEVKAGADAPILDRGEGLGQLPDRARHCRRNQNLPRKPGQHSENETHTKKEKILLDGYRAAGQQLTLLRASSAISPGPRWREAAGASALRRGLHAVIDEALVLVVEKDGEEVQGGGRRVTQDEDGMCGEEKGRAMAVGTAWRAGLSDSGPVACLLCQTACTGNRQIALHFLVLLCLSVVTANRLTDHVPVCLDRSGSTESCLKESIA